MQIILGMIWGIANFAKMQEFGETYIYIETSKTLVCDEYIGILYSLLVFVAKGLESLFVIPWFCFLYVMQLAVAGWAAYRLVVTLQDVLEKNVHLVTRVWVVLSILTIPQVLQCHLAVLPNSLSCSLYMAMVTYGVRTIRDDSDKTKKNLVVLGALWVAVSLLMPEYRVLGGVLFVVVIIRKIKNTRKVQMLLLLVLFFGMTVGFSVLAQIHGAQGHAKDSLALKAVSRFVWPDFQEYHGMWPDEIKNAISWEEAGVISRTADGIQTVFAPMMEQALGEKEAEKVYWKLVGTAAHIRTRDIVESIVWDGACHIFSPYLLTKQLEGVGYQSYSGRNYEIMKAHTPGITKHYIAYEGWWFVTGIVVAALISIITINDKRKSLLAGKGLLIVSALVMVIYYTMQGAGIMDYKQTIYVTVLWTLWMCSRAIPDKTEM